MVSEVRIKSNGGSDNCRGSKVGQEPAENLSWMLCWFRDVVNASSSCVSIDNSDGVFGSGVGREWDCRYSDDALDESERGDISNHVLHNRDESRLTPS